MMFDPELYGLRFFKLTMEFLAILGTIFFTIDGSEMADDCNGLLRRALVDCSWTKCSSKTRRDICMLLRRVQRSHHMKFYDGAIVLSRVFFLNITKIAYRFVNFVRIGY
uniref:Odorant receptor n=1 Tax=Cacopsylla melanoneura TaxID=428564 RepID=A0A8D8X2I6_9HEMI